MPFLSVADFTLPLLYSLVVKVNKDCLQNNVHRREDGERYLFYLNICLQINNLWVYSSLILHCADY